MPSVEERVAHLEGRVEVHGKRMDDFRAEMRAFQTEVRGDFMSLRSEMNHRFERLESKVDRQFTWLVGLQIAGLVAVGGALVGSYYK